MTDTIREPASLVEAAEQAAASGDYASAERLLREAARVQELRLGPEHPDVANTLNNLAVVCEIREKPEEAERCYRRAFAIATVALGQDHPFSITSGNNLKAFCLAQGKAVEGSVAASSSVASPDPPVSGAMLDAAPVIPSADPLPSRAFASQFSRPFQIVSVAAIVLVFGLLVVFMAIPASRPGSQSPDIRPGAGESALSGASARERSAGDKALEASTPRPSSTSTVESAAAAPTAGATAAGGRPARAPKAAESSAAAAPARATSDALPGVADALICKTLATRAEADRPASWRCEPVKASVEAGPLSFYTRITSARDTTVRHLWYQGDQLRRSVELQVRANPASGYRTFSRVSVSSSAGPNWRVELRTDDGVLLYEQRIAVR